MNDITANPVTSSSDLVELDVDGVRYAICLPQAATDYIQGKIATERVPYERDMLEDMCTRLKPGDLVVDVGANIGNHTLYLAAATGCEVDAFEANVALCEGLRKSVAANGFGDRVRVHAVGVGSASGTAAFAEQKPDNLGAQRLAVGAGEIEIVTLDSLGWARPVRMLKIDVEGMEMDVLRGARALVERDRPMLYIECIAEKELRQVSRWAEALGYSYWDTFNATPTHLFVPAESVDVERRLARLHLMAYREEARSIQIAGQVRGRLNKAYESEREARKETAELSVRLAEARSRMDAAQKDLAAKAAELARVSGELGQLQQAAATQRGELQRAAAAEQALAQQVEKLQAELQEARRTGEQQAAQLQRAFQQMEQRNLNFLKERSELQERLENTLSYQLGYTLLHGFRSWSGVARLVPDLLRLRKESRRRRRSREDKWTAHAEARPKAAGTAKAPTPAPQAAPAPRLPVLERKLRIAGVMDEFTEHSYGPECELLQLRPEGLEQQLAGFDPDLLFLESAWRGADGLWQTKVSNAAPEVLEAIAWCRKRGIPTLLWNKEDPVHFTSFLPLAKAVDYVFTTDVDCIPRYKRAVGHDRVYLLPFAAQPRLHNPIELYERKDAFNFAGSYYLRYPERQRDFAALVDTLQQFRPVEIYDRNYGRPHPHYQFPDKYAPLILGSLPFAEIDRAYKGYRYGLNMNTIKQSQTMFARRVFELLASNTVVVSNFSRGVRLLFGDLVVSSDEAGQISRRIAGICQDDTTYRKMRLLGLRKVMSEHTYAHRLAYVAGKLGGRAGAARPRSVALLAYAHDAQAFERLVRQFRDQAHPAKRLFMVAGFEHASRDVDPDVRVFADAAACSDALQEERAAFDLVGLFHADDHYGPNYLTDLALAPGYSQAVAFCKTAHFTAQHGQCALQGDGQQYRRCDGGLARAGLARASALTPELAAQWLERPADAALPGGETLGLDEFNYCRDGAALAAAALEPAADLRVADQGISFAGELASFAERIEGGASDSPERQDDLPQLSAEALLALLQRPSSNLLKMDVEEGVLKIASRLPEGKVAHVWAQHALDRSELNLVLNSQIRLECDGKLDLRTIFEFQTESGTKIAHTTNPVGATHALAIPPDCRLVRIALRICGPGTAAVRRLVLGSYGERPPAVVGRSPYLVLTKQYPAYDDLYRYGFLHSRLRGYLREGLPVDVFRITSEAGDAYREFEGIDVASGDAALLDATLKAGRHEHVLVHLLDEKMWTILQQHLDRVRVTVWVHGAEIQVWQRRAFEFDRFPEEEVARRKKLSDNRSRFWRALLAMRHPNLHFVFVSRHLAREVEEDLGVTLQPEQFSVVHNFIDGDLFTYGEKTAADRTRLLSIRPYSGLTYANDLTVKAILELSRRPFFQELRFLLVGDGELFEETTKDLRDLPNVTLRRQFLTHQQIRDLHREHGVFLTPTRMDSQGVSRDEAMASGLVPVTTDVAAVPEFVDAESGLLVPPEDPVAIADAVERLYRDPDLFLRLSRNAARRVRQQSSFEQTIGREVHLIRGSGGPGRA